MMPHRFLLRLCGAVLVALSLVPAHAAQANPSQPAAVTASDQEIARFFDDYTKRTMTRLGIPGAAVIVVRDGRQIFAQGYGYSDVKSRRPVDVNSTLFRAASASKLLPWLLTMQLVEEGRLNLDADVNTYLDFKIPYRFGKPITMRHLMTHTAGFAERFHGVFDQDLSRPLGDMLRDNVPLQAYAPGTTVAYSNYGAALAGYIVQRLRHQPWDRVVAERIFRPVEMTSSTVMQPVPAAMQPRLASTYSFGSDEPGPFRVTPLAPMGSLTPTAADMGRLLLMLQNGGRAPGGRVLRAATLARMFALQRPLGPNLPDGFGLGFLVGEYHGTRYAGHAGNMSTLATDLELLPEAGLGWYYVFNSQGEREGARQVRLDLLEKAIDRFVAGPVEGPRPHGPSTAADVAGQYTSTRRIFSGPLMFSGLMDTTETFAEPDGSLSVLSAGELTRFVPDGRDRFLAQDSGIPLAISRDSAGNVSRIASAALYPAAVFERASPLVFIVPIVAAASAGAYLLFLLAKVLVWLHARLRREKAEARRSARQRGWLDDGARLARWLVPLLIVGWAAYALALAIDFTILFEAPAIVPVTLGLLAALLAPAAALLWVFLARRWHERGWGQRTPDMLIALATSGFAWLAYTLDFVNVTSNW